MESHFDDYVEALLKEIAAAEPSETPLESIYFGGGTPTVLPVDALEDILDALRARFRFAPDAEITIEANPGTVDLSILSALREIGFNRLSMGVQSFDDTILGRIGRVHTADQAREAFSAGRAAGFNNISIDLMYALPDQTASDWHSTLESALALAPEHISLYELTVEERTVFGNLRKHCMLNLPDEDLQIEMYTDAIKTLTANGYEHYEISNFAIQGRRSRHNQTYWRNEPYFGFGAGATAYVGGVRSTNLADPAAYIDKINSDGNAVESSEVVTGRLAMGETIMLGLRMLDGVDLPAFEARFDVSLEQEYASEVSELRSRGLIELTKTHLRLTHTGLFIANEVAAEFL